MNPTVFDSYIGQGKIIRQLLPELKACTISRSPLRHMVLYGPPGLGKNTLTYRIAEFLGAPTPIIEVKGTEILAAGNKWNWNTVLLRLRDDQYNFPAKEPMPTRPFPQQLIMVDECDSVPLSQWECLHDVLVPRENGKLQCNFPPPNNPRGPRLAQWVPFFTLILATNFYDKLSKNAGAVLSRCGFKFRFELYGVEELARIVTCYGRKRGIPTQDDAAINIAHRSRGTPRRAEQLWDQCNNERVLTGASTITAQHVKAVMDRSGISHDGLTDDDIQYLTTLARANGGKVGASTLASMLGMSEQTMSIDIESWLLSQGLIMVASGGRTLTSEGLQRISGGNAMEDSLLRRLL